MVSIERIYSKEDIASYVDMEVIDKEEYAIITGEKYPENLRVIGYNLMAF